MALGLRRADLPDARLESIARLHGCREAHPEERQRAWVPTADGRDDRTRSEPERRQAVQDDAAKAGRGANRRVCIRAVM